MAPSFALIQGAESLRGPQPGSEKGPQSSPCISSPHRLPALSPGSQPRAGRAGSTWSPESTEVFFPLSLCGNNLEESRIPEENMQRGLGLLDPLRGWGAVSLTGGCCRGRAPPGFPPVRPRTPVSSPMQSAPLEWETEPVSCPRGPAPTPSLNNGAVVPTPSPFSSTPLLVSFFSSSQTPRHQTHLPSPQGSPLLRWASLLFPVPHTPPPPSDSSVLLPFTPGVGHLSLLQHCAPPRPMANRCLGPREISSLDGDGDGEGTWLLPRQSQKGAEEDP